MVARTRPGGNVPTCVYHVKSRFQRVLDADDRPGSPAPSGASVRLGLDRVGGGGGFGEVLVAEVGDHGIAEEGHAALEPEGLPGGVELRGHLALHPEGDDLHVGLLASGTLLDRAQGDPALGSFRQLPE